MTPANVTSAPIQNEWESVSRRSAIVISPMNTGVAPSRSATVEALASWTP